MSNNTKTTVANYLLIRLKQLGLHKVFQVAGDYVVGFMDALERFEGIEAVGCVDELCAAYAADGYARIRGIGAISVQYGVGTLSAVNGVAGSYVEKNPVIVVSAGLSTQNRKFAQQGIHFPHMFGKLDSSQKTYKLITAASEIILNPDKAPTQIDQALVKAITSRQPIYLEAAENVWSLPCNRPIGTLQPLALSSCLGALKASVDATLKLLKSAGSPIIILGSEIHSFSLQAKITELVIKSGLPYATSLSGKSVIAESTGHFIGTYIGAGSSAITRSYFKEADCYLFIGDSITNMYLDLLEDQFPYTAVINSELCRVGYQYYHSVEMGDFISSLLDSFNKSKALTPPAQHDKNVSPLFDSESANIDAPLTYTRFLDSLYRYMYQNNLFGDIKLILGESSAIYPAVNYTGFPENGFISGIAWGSLGHETGSALGVALACSDRAFVVSGDGGFMMASQTLSTMTRYRLNPVIFVMSNQVYAVEQAAINPEAFKPDGHFAEYNILAKWDYQELAKAYGAQGFKAQTISELETVFCEISLIIDRPCLVEVKIPKKDLAPELKRLIERS